MFHGGIVLRVPGHGVLVKDWRSSHVELLA